MRILHCNIHESQGGASIATQRIHHALLNEDVSSLIGVMGASSNSPLTIKLRHDRTFLQKILNKASEKVLSCIKTDRDIYYSKYFTPSNISRAILEQKPDIIHLHWISTVLSSYDLKKISKFNIPTVWTLHDTWAFTGGCHYGSCEEWKRQCRECAIIKRFYGFNISHLQWMKKKGAYDVLRPYIVAPSKKMLQKVQTSSLLKNMRSTHIPNPIDTEVFRPIEKSLARNLLGLEQDKIYILYGALSATSDHNKGYDLLVDALNIFHSQYEKECQCLVFGSSAGKDQAFRSTFLGRLYDPLTLALTYSAADVFVCPSREENLPNTILESLACGTPVVGFNIGGIPDMVEHKKNGYVATPYDTQDLANGIAYVLGNNVRYESMCIQARATVEASYENSIVARQYLKLYRELLKA